MADTLNMALGESIKEGKSKPVVSQILGAQRLHKEPTNVKLFLARCQRMLAPLGLRVHP